MSDGSDDRGRLLQRTHVRRTASGLVCDAQTTRVRPLTEQAQIGGDASVIDRCIPTTTRRDDQKFDTEILH